MTPTPQSLPTAGARGTGGAAPWGTVIVTGGSSGLGAAVVDLVRARGGRPVVLDRQAPADTAGLEWVKVDLSDAHAAHEAAREAAEHADHLTGVVTAAGTDACGRLIDTPLDDWVRVISVNLIGTAAVVRGALPSLERSGGRVVTVASTLGLKAVSDASAYCASKFGVVGLTRALATELAGQVGVTLLVPGGMRTAFFDGRTEQYKPGPDADLLDPASVAEVIGFALDRPAGEELRELVFASSTEPSWP
jgi:NAD(P)-dependent dehydrogenase (short-subunit alcohol dehydrogenase family)